MVIKLSLDNKLAASHAMCSTATSEMTFPVPPRLSHLPQDVDVTTNCHQQQQQQHFSQHYQHQQQQHSPSILEFTTSTVSRQYTYDPASVAQQLSPQDRAMYNGTGPTTSFTAALTQDHPPPAISSESLSETSQSQPLQTSDHHTIPSLPTPTNMATYYENTFTRTLTGIYLQPPNNTYRSPPDDMYTQRGGGDSTQQTEYIPTNNSYKNYPRSHYDGYSMPTSHSSEQDPQVSSGGLNSSFYPTTTNPYNLYRNTGFNNNNNNNPDSMFTTSSKYGGKIIYS